MQIWSIGFYLFLQLGIAFLVGRYIKSEKDYLLAGRNLGPWLTTFGIFATWFGAETCLGAAGRVYENGLSGASADPFGYALCILLMGIFIARPIWKLKLTTLGDLFRIKYGKRVEKIAVLIMIPTSLFWAAAQIRGFGAVLSSVSGWNLEIMISVAAGIVIVYTTMGGLLADAITDLIQGGILVIGLLVLAYFVLTNVDYSVLQTIDHRSLAIIDIKTNGVLGTLESWSIPILGSMVAAELLTRAMAAKSAKVARRSSFNAFFIYLFIGIIPVIIGLIGPIIFPGLTVPEQIIPMFAETYLPPVLYILFMGALLSAILSTVDSALLASGSLFSHNIILGIWKKDLDESIKLIVSRITMVCFGIIAYIMAMKAEGVYHLVEEASAFGSTGILVCVLFGLFGKKVFEWSAVGSLLMGVMSYVFLNYFLGSEYPFLISMLFAFTGFVVINTILWFKFENSKS